MNPLVMDYSHEDTTGAKWPAPFQPSLPLAAGAAPTRTEAT